MHIVTTVFAESWSIWQKETRDQMSKTCILELLTWSFSAINSQKWKQSLVAALLLSPICHSLHPSVYAALIFNMQQG